MFRWFKYVLLLGTASVVYGELAIGCQTYPNFTETLSLKCTRGNYKLTIKAYNKTRDVGDWSCSTDTGFLSSSASTTIDWCGMVGIKSGGCPRTGKPYTFTCMYFGDATFATVMLEHNNIDVASSLGCQTYPNFTETLSLKCTRGNYKFTIKAYNKTRDVGDWSCSTDTGFLSSSASTTIDWCVPIAVTVIIYLVIFVVALGSIGACVFCGWRIYRKKRQNQYESM